MGLALRDRDKDRDWNFGFGLGIGSRDGLEIGIEDQHRGLGFLIGCWDGGFVLGIRVQDWELVFKTSFGDWVLRLYLGLAIPIGDWSVLIV